jgi:3-keto-disaccharide hydrolase
MRFFLLKLFILLVVIVGCKSKEEKKTQTANSNADSKVEKSDLKIKLKIEKKFSFDFEKGVIGKLPAPWKKYLTGNGIIGKWQIVKDGDNSVLGQVSLEGKGKHYNILVNEKIKYKNLEIKVKFKGVKGTEDQGGGPVWRFLDKNNYYVARANPLENNYRVYKVKKGVRYQLATAELPVDSGVWYTLTVKMVEDHIECFLNGKKYLDIKDSTFKSAGKTGLWTKADAFTYFDNMKIRKID